MFLRKLYVVPGELFMRSMGDMRGGYYVVIIKKMDGALIDQKISHQNLLKKRGKKKPLKMLLRMFLMIQKGHIMMH